MNRPLFAAAVSLLVLTGAAAPVIAQLAPDQLARKAKAVLQAHCYKCHGDGGRAEAGMFVLNYRRLLDTKKIVPNNLKASRLYKRLAVDADMPPESDDDGKPIARPTADGLAAVKAWIEAGAPDFADAAPPKRAFVSDLDVLKAILADLERAGERDRRFLRYFTITHLYNAGLSDDELAGYRAGLSKLVNSLSWGREIHVPAVIDAARTVFRIDLRDLDWDEGVWDATLAANPYGVTYQNATAKACYAHTRTPLPYVRADWFVFAASKPPLYYQALRLPDTVAELEKRLEVDAERNIRQERVWRAAFNGSGVSRNNRLIERHRSPYGAYWKSYDFAGNVGRQNLFQCPLGPGQRANEFQHDGGEIIFNLPNGLQAYFLTDGRGRRLDRGPTNIVSDPRQGDRAVVHGVSCMSCHAQGMITKDDQVRAHVEGNPDAFEKAERDLILALYPKKDVFDGKLKEDAERFGKAVRETGARLSKTEPVYLLAKQFENEVGPRLAAAEAGMTLDEFRRALERSPALARVFGPLRSDGGTVQRDALVASFADLVRELRPDGASILAPGGRAGALLEGPVEFKPHLPADESEVVTLPGAVSDVAVGGGGRYLVCRLKKSLAVFDVQQGKVVRELPVAEEGAHFAAGATRVVVLLPNAQLVQVWDLTTLERIRSAPFPGALTQDEIRQVCMGSASNGPLFIYLPNQKRTLALNPATLDVTEVNWKAWGPRSAYGPLHMRAAPDGDTLVGWFGGWAGAEMASFRDGAQTGSDNKIAFSGGLFALPSADGRRLFTPDGIINRDGGVAKVTELSNAYPVPAHEPGFFVALHSQGRYPGASFDKGPTANLPAVSQVAVYTDDGQRLFAVAGIDGLKAGAGLFWERRVHYYPRGGLLAVLTAPDRLLLRRVDLVKQLDKTGADYMVVVSQAPAARRGATWSYQLDVRAKAGPAKVKPEAGPDGLTVTPDGRIAWRVPQDYPTPAVTVKLTLRDANGQEVLHQFSAAVVPAKNASKGGR